MLFSIFILTILLISLIGARNVISTHLQLITWLTTGNRKLAVIVYSLVFLPGIIIHEISHFFMAAFLGVRTGEITIFPSVSTEDGEQHLGSVEVTKTDMFRSSLIGIAPLVFGSIFIIAVTKWQFPQILNNLSQFSWPLNQLLIEGKNILAIPLNFVWIYLIFAISNTMFVSSADRRSWPAMIILLLLISGLAISTGTATSVIQSVKTPLIIGINILNAAFLISLIIDVIFIIPLLGVEKLLTRFRHSK